MSPTADRRAERAALAGVRRVLRGRAGLPSRGDLAYGVYLGVMLVVVAVAPLVRAVVLALAEGLPASPPPGAAPAAVGVLSGVVAVAALLGAQTGPAHARLPEVDLLHASALSRGRLLAGPLARSFLAAGALGLLLAGVLVAALALRGGLGGEGGSPLSAGVALLCGGAGIGLLAATAMLLGQLGRGQRRALAMVFGALAAVFGVLGVLTGLGAGLPAPPQPAMPDLLLPPLLLLLVGVAGALCSPLLAGRMRGGTLREQSVRLGTVSALALSGDLRMATARLGAPVRTGRGLGWRAPRRIGAAILSRDLLGLIRTPARSLAALVVASAAGALIGGLDPARAGWGPAALLGAVAVVAAYAAIGPWCRGLRAAAETVGGFALTPLTPAGLLLRHLVVPGVLAAVSIGASAGLVAAIAGPADPGSVPPLTAAAEGAAVALVALLLRLAGALKGPLPQSLLAPVPTPVGDVSGINVALWALDGVLVAAVAGAVLGGVSTASALAGAIAAGLVLALLAVWALLRLRAAR